MKMIDLKRLCGVPIEEFKKSSIKYRIWVLAIYAIDIAAMCGLTAFMFYNYYQYQWYGVAVVVVCVAVNLFAYFRLKPGRHELFMLYKRNKAKLVMGKCYDIKWHEFYDMLVKIKPGIKADTALADLKAEMQELCLASIKNNVRIMKALSKCEVEFSDFKCLVLEHGRKQYFLGFVSDLLQAVEVTPVAEQDINVDVNPNVTVNEEEE